MPESPGEELLVLPPIPLATGQLLPGGDSPSRRITAVEVVVLTEDGAEHRIPLVERHGAWWPPER